MGLEPIPESVYSEFAEHLFKEYGKHLERGVAEWLASVY